MYKVKEIGLNWTNLSLSSWRNALPWQKCIIIYMCFSPGFFQIFVTKGNYLSRSMLISRISYCISRNNYSTNRNLTHSCKLRSIDAEAKMIQNSYKVFHEWRCSILVPFQTYSLPISIFGVYNEINIWIFKLYTVRNCFI